MLFSESRHHEKWGEVDLDESIPGWKLDECFRPAR
jgi:hypothetical protein